MSQVKQNLEKQREQLFSFLKLLDVHSDSKQCVEITVKFKHKKFGDSEGVASIKVDKHSFVQLEPILEAIMNSAQNLALRAVDELREINDRQYKEGEE